MNKQDHCYFLCRRMKELREKNGCSQDDMAKKLNIANKSTISRIEGGKISKKNLHAFAREYCDAFKMSETQIDEFLRGDRIVIPDTSALLCNPQLIDELNEEYSKVVIPKNVIDELSSIKNKSSNRLAKKAWEIISSIKYGNKVITMEYSVNANNNTDCKIIQIAEQAVERYGCKVDIITNDIDYSAYLKKEDDYKVKAIHLREYLITKQGIMNMVYLIELNNYFSDNYDNYKKPTIEEANAYIPEGRYVGNTLIINAIRNKNVSFEQKKKKILWLLSCGANIDKRDCSRRFFPPLSHAVQMSDAKMVAFLLNECEANPNIGNRNPFDAGKIRHKNEGNMPLMIASYFTTKEWDEKREQILRDLCKHPKISINQQDANGFTALIKACMNGNAKCRNILLKYGADTKIVDLDGKNADDWWNDCLEFGPAKDRRRKNNK